MGDVAAFHISFSLLLTQRVGHTAVPLCLCVAEMEAGGPEDWRGGRGGVACFRLTRAGGGTELGQGHVFDAVVLSLPPLAAFIVAAWPWQ